MQVEKGVLTESKFFMVCFRNELLVMCLGKNKKPRSKRPILHQSYWNNWCIRPRIPRRQLA